MQTFKVYHSKHHDFQVVDIAAFNEENYVLVAEVDAEHEDDAYKLTNTIHGPWVLNEEVRPTMPGRLRSTSVGDVIVSPDGTRLLVLPVGWRVI
jgi:hypothetical protein